MFNHTKDIPLAAAMMGALYFLMRVARDLPAPRRSDVLWFGVLLGVALGLRATALLIVLYLACSGRCSSGGAAGKAAERGAVRRARS